jgi:hypothetical protein
MGLEIVRSMIASDPHVAFHMRRYVWFRLMFDERGTPLERQLKLSTGSVDAARYTASLSESIKGTELHRAEAALGYRETPPCSTMTAIASGRLTRTTRESNLRLAALLLLGATSGRYLSRALLDSARAMTCRSG